MGDPHSPGEYSVLRTGELGGDAFDLGAGHRGPALDLVPGGGEHVGAEFLERIEKFADRSRIFFVAAQEFPRRINHHDRNVGDLIQAFQMADKIDVIAEIRALEHQAPRTALRVENRGARVDDGRAVLTGKIDAYAIAFLDGHTLPKPLGGFLTRFVIGGRQHA